jgi:hypothetical protein
MKDEKRGNEREKMPEKETPEQEQDKRVSKSETIEDSNPEKRPQNEEDLLYTHKSENKVGGIQWNSAFCRKPGR